jgi:hypothetical protein
MKLYFEKIRIDGGTQTRAKLNEDAVARYIEEIKNGTQFPPLTTFYDGQDYWLADGFHRLRAYLQNLIFEIEIEARQGTRRDAILYSVGANAEHGLPRSNEDKRRAVMVLFNDGEWKNWSDRQIASACKVHHSFVSRLRSSLSLNDSGSDPSKLSPRVYVSKHGSVAQMDTRNIGKSRTNSGHISSKAFTPVRQPEEIVPMLSISLPLNNPNMGAKALLNRFEHDYVVALHKELTILLGTQE